MGVHSRVLKGVSSAVTVIRLYLWEHMEKSNTLEDEEGISITSAIKKE